MVTYLYYWYSGGLNKAVTEKIKSCIEEHNYKGFIQIREAIKEAFGNEFYQLPDKISIFYKDDSVGEVILNEQTFSWIDGWDYEHG